MKLVTAIVRPSKLEAVWLALSDFGVRGVTVTEIKGFGLHAGYTEIYRGTKYKMTSMPRVKIEIAIQDDKVEAVIALIQEVAATGEVGDGKIFVLDLERAVRIRTGDFDEDAL